MVVVRVAVAPRDVGFGEVQLLAEVRQTGGDLCVERDLGLALLVARKRGLIKALAASS